MARDAADLIQISFRLPPDWLKRLDAVAEGLSRPGLELARADAIRMAIAKGLEDLEAELKAGRGKR
jgi:predicted DNA-binding protein